MLDNRDLPVVCAGGVRSARAAAFLMATGRERVTDLAGGTNAWKQAGQPVKMGQDP